MQGLSHRLKLCFLAFSVGCLVALETRAQGTANTAQRPALEPRSVESPSNDSKSSPLSAEQVAKVKAVLAAYSPSTLKVDDAKAIKRALREAGLPHNAALEKAISDAGFSPRKLEELDPRPAHPPGPRATQGSGASSPPSPPPPPPGRSADAPPSKP